MLTRINEVISQTEGEEEKTGEEKEEPVKIEKKKEKRKKSIYDYEVKKVKQFFQGALCLQVPF